MLGNGATLDGIAAQAEARRLDPQPVSGQQEKLENIVNRYV
jgi:xylose isomerase